MGSALSESLYLYTITLHHTFDLSEAISWILYQTNAIGELDYALLSECYRREQRGELPQRRLVETYFLQRTEVGGIFLWVLERPAKSQNCTHERGLRHSTFPFFMQNGCFRLHQPLSSTRKEVASSGEKKLT